MFMVYWSSLVEDKLVPGSEEFVGPNEMNDALKFMDHKRKEGARCVTFVQENEHCVTKPGVDAVENGVTPDGFAYEWSKKHRGGGPR